VCTVRRGDERGGAHRKVEAEIRTATEGDGAEGTEDDTSEIDCTSCSHIAITSTSVERHEIQIKGFTSLCRPEVFVLLH